MNRYAFSDEQLAGQRLMVGFDGTELNNELKSLIEKLRVGGVILFSRNLVAPEQIRELCLSVQEYAKSSGQPPLFIAIDQEGGQVARLKKPFTEFPGNPFIKNEKDAIWFAEVTSRELKRVGINMNMAPVMDVPPEGFKSVMDKRVFGSDPGLVSKLGTAIIRSMQENGIMAVAKHFPGIGRTTLDSHIDLPTLDTNLHTLEAFDFIPFEAAIKENVSGIMMSHICYSAIDPKWPAGLSPKIADRLLRERMGYQGLVMTDDLDMGAICNYYKISTSIKQILVSGIDIAMICHKGPDIQSAYNEILHQVAHSHEIKENTLVSVRRIMKAKEAYCMIS
jgi:beta-N-acetylhexosaminidase